VVAPEKEGRRGGDGRYSAPKLSSDVKKSRKKKGGKSVGNGRRFKGNDETGS